MAKSFWIYIALISSFFILTVASKKGKGKSGGWDSRGNRNPSYPGNTGSNWNPNNPGNTGSNWKPNQPGNPGSNWNQGGSWGNNYNPGGSNYNKQFKPPKTKTNMKMVAGAAVAGAVGGFVLGNAVSNMRYSFDNDMDRRYYNSYQNQMPNQVYRPSYVGNPHVTEDRFVTDCYNMTMTEYVMKPSDGKNGSDVDPAEYRVKSTIVRQLCVSEFKRGPEYYNGSELNLLFSPKLILFITLFVYFVVE
ncbi:major prion protein homolog [Bufo bufo]|uniref:major prion protein homolog n=1 Tax=Bufo bufo TaxID=8384 RepID=UPI001ABDD4E2|nr:major prion protein homolog [Bufo bufo]